jgi:hypothetical protein
MLSSAPCQTIRPFCQIVMNRRRERRAGCDLLGPAARWQTLCRKFFGTKYSSVSAPSSRKSPCLRLICGQKFFNICR